MSPNLWRFFSGRAAGQRLTAAVLSLALLGFADAPAARGAQRPDAVGRLRKPDVHYEPSPHAVVGAMLKLAAVRGGDVLYDLGSGDGRIPIAAARDYGARAVGIDIDPKRIAQADANAKAAGVSDRVAFRHEDLFEADIRAATVVTLFLSPELNLKLRPKLLTMLRPGTRVVSHMHDMGDWRPARTVQVRGRRIYLWVVPP